MLKVVIINNHDVSATPEQELVQDVLEVYHRVFCAKSEGSFSGSATPENVPPGQNLRSCASFARLYGLRSHQNNSLIKELDKSAKKISETYGIDLKNTV